MALAVLAAALGAPDAQAALACGDGEATRAFARFLDPFQYVLAPGGDFESAGEWTLTGDARIVAGNEPFYLHSGSDRSSLFLPPGSSATSPPMCLGIDRPTLRFVAESSGSALALLHVEAILRTREGRTLRLPVLPVAGLLHRSWAPTLPLPLLVDKLVRDVATLDLATTEVQFRLTPTSGFLTRGSWRVDDVYVDPWADRWM